MAALIWVVPAGEYQRAPNEALSNDVALPGTYAQLEAAPQGLLDPFRVPIAGFYDPNFYTANPIDVSLFVPGTGGLFWPRHGHGRH